MNKLLSQCCLCAVTCFAAAGPRVNAATADDVAVGDAFVRSEANGTRWVIEARAVEQVFDLRGQ